jgi:hypothetical protein
MIQLGGSKTGEVVSRKVQYIFLYLTFISFLSHIQQVIDILNKDFINKNACINHFTYSIETKINVKFCNQFRRINNQFKYLVHHSVFQNNYNIAVS